MSPRSISPVKPHTRTKAARETALLDGASDDDEWAERIWQTMLSGCHRFQLDAAIDPAKRYSFLCGRGATKTTTFRVRGIRVCTRKHRAKTLYFAKTRQRAKDLMWFPLKAVLHRLGFVAGQDVTFNETELRCTFHRTGSMLMLSGLQDIADADKWRGDTFDEVQFDECGAIAPELLEYTIYQVIGPRVHCLGLGGTPGIDRRGPFYEVTRPGSEAHRPYVDRDKADYDGFNGYSSHSWDLEDIIALPNAQTLYPELCRLWDEALDEKARNKWSDDNPIWLREYKRVWASDGTLRVFGSYQPHKDSAPWNEWDPHAGAIIEGILGLRIALEQLKKQHEGVFTEWRFVIGMDQGHAKPYACNVFTFSPNDAERRLWHVMYLERLKMHAKPIAEILIGPGLKHDKPEGVFGIIGWPDGIVFDADWPLIDELSNVYGIRVTKADKKPEYKAGAIEVTNGDFTDRRIFVIKNSPLAKQCEQLQWKVSESGKLIEDPAQANHSTDTLIYARLGVAQLFESGAVTQDVRPVQTVQRATGEIPFPQRDEFDGLLTEASFDDIDGWR